MADRDEGATVRLAATIARSRHEADGGTLLEGIHPDTIVEMSLAAKREVDSLRADLARVTAERDARLDMSPSMLGAVLEAYENGEEDVEHSDKCAVCEAVSAVREFVARSANAANGGG